MEQSIYAMLAYEDPAAILDWLARAFGFVERMRHSEPDGTISHAEMEYRGSVIMLATPTPDYQDPVRHRADCAAAAKWSTVPYVINGLLVMVDDVDAHYRRAVGAGATILSEPEDGFPARRYRCEDPAGQRWMFMQG